MNLLNLTYLNIFNYIKLMRFLNNSAEFDTVVNVYVQISKVCFPIFYIFFQFAFILFKTVYINLIIVKNSTIIAFSVLTNQNINGIEFEFNYNGFNICDFNYITSLFDFNKKKEIVEIKKEDKIDIFINSYINKYNKKDMNDDNIYIPNENSYLFCNTPLGNIIMAYNNDTFVYYCDASIPYRCLDVIGRKYVCSFNCCQLYNWNVEDNEENDEKVDNENNEGNDGNDDNEEGEEKIDVINNSNIKNKAEIKSYNKYKCIGKFYDFSFIKKKQSIDNISTFNYEDFKKMNISS